jgi:NADH:ubiquinone oxidoreductase subunit 6 (subunit J)
MVLFIFIVMMLKIELTPASARAWLRQWAPAVALSTVAAAIMVFLIWQEPAPQTVLHLAMAGPQKFGRFVYQRYWFAVEIASFLLFVALVGAYYLGRRESGSEDKS